MLAPLPNPEPQFADGNGVPYAGGTIGTFVPGTSTAKSTWSDAEQTALNTNPIVLDSAGRCTMYGTGAYRLILKDADGNLIWDQETSNIDTSGLVTMAQVNAAVQTETDRATAAETTLTNNLNAEVTRAENAEANLQSQITGITGAGGILPPGYSIRAGSAASNADGSYTVTVSPTFPTGIVYVVTTAGRNVWCSVDSTSGNTFSGWTSSPEFGGTWNQGPQGFQYIAIGH